MPASFDENKLFDLFAYLVSTDSPTYGERQQADKLKALLTDLGFEVSEDSAGERLGGSAGNLYGILKGTDPARETVLFSSHLDTVSPALGKKAVLHEDGTVTSGGDTVLGADDAAGLVEILEGIRSAISSGRPYGDIEVLLPVAEEVYTKGSKLFDLSRIHSKTAYVLDMSGDIGSAAIKAPSIISFKAEVKGRASHSGFAPEKGINALAAAARVIASTPQGRLDKETTFNIGTLTSGEASNIVPERVVLTGEARGFDHEKALAAVLGFRENLEREAKAIGASVSFEHTVEVRAYSVPEDAEVTKRFLSAAERIGIEGRTVTTHGGSDNHTLTAGGINGIVLSCGMYSVHSVNEYTKLRELAKGAALVRELILGKAGGI